MVTRPPDFGSAMCSKYFVLTFTRQLFPIFLLLLCPTAHSHQDFLLEHCDLDFMCNTSKVAVVKPDGSTINMLKQSGFRLSLRGKTLSRPKGQGEVMGGPSGRDYELGYGYGCSSDSPKKLAGDVFRASMYSTGSLIYERGAVKGTYIDEEHTIVWFGSCDVID